jgi:transposase
MDIVVERGAGLDVHKATVVACIRGTGVEKEIRTYLTMTNDLLRLKEWLKGHGITHVAMESTGVYWKPVFIILEDSFEVILVNARHVKNIPGRKTDVKDSEWLCKLLRSGLVRGSFIPPKEVRELRDLTRYKRKLIQTITSEKQRVEKILEDANIKLSSIASDTFGASGKRIVQELMKGEMKPEAMADLSKGGLRNRKGELKEALVGNMEDHHRFMIQTSLNHITMMEEILSTVEQKIQETIECRSVRAPQNYTAGEGQRLRHHRRDGGGHGPLFHRDAPLLLVGDESRQQRERGGGRNREPPHTGTSTSRPY